jgi:hypothetical protein
VCRASARTIGVWECAVRERQIGRKHSKYSLVCARSRCSLFIGLIHETAANPDLPERQHKYLEGRPAGYYDPATFVTVNSMPWHCGRRSRP